MATPGPEPMVTEDEIVELVRTADDPFTTASEVAERVGMARQTAHKHLQELYEEGEIQKKKVGQSAIWWVEDRAD